MVPTNAFARRSSWRRAKSHEPNTKCKPSEVPQGAFGAGALVLAARYLLPMLRHGHAMVKPMRTSQPFIPIFLSEFSRMEPSISWLTGQRWERPFAHPSHWCLTRFQSASVRRRRCGQKSWLWGKVARLAGGSFIKRLFLSRKPKPGLLLRLRVIARSCVHAQLRYPFGKERQFNLDLPPLAIIFRGVRSVG